MKRAKQIAVGFVMAFITILALPSCSNDSDKATSGVWYLVSYGSSNIECTWGECLVFNGNELMWGLRDRGTTNSYFRYTCSGKNIKCVAQDNSDDITFTVESVSDGKMVTTSTDGIKRHWRR